MKNVPPILPDRHQIFVIMFVGAILLIVANLIVWNALRRKGLSAWHMFDLKVLSKLEARDNVKLLLLILLFFAVELLLARLMGITID
jgi:hypothetical protein